MRPEPGVNRTVPQDYREQEHDEAHPVHPIENGKPLRPGDDIVPLGEDKSLRCQRFDWEITLRHANNVLTRPTKSITKNPPYNSENPTEPRDMAALQSNKLAISQST